MPINLGSYLSKRAMLNSNKEALVCEEVRLNWTELNGLSNQLGYAMKKLGVGYGDRVGLLALNEPEYLAMFYGLGKIGAILVPINYRIAGPEMEYILNNSGCKVFVFGPGYVDIVDTIRCNIGAQHFVALMDTPPKWASSYKALTGNESTEEPEHVGGDDDVLTILYTSGTTGRPKGSMLTHRNFFVSATNLIATLGDLGKTALLVLPLFHIGGLGNVPLAPQLGLRTVMLKSLDPKRMLELIQEEKVNVFGSVPALLQILKMVPDFEKYDWSSVQKVFVYAAPLPVSLLEEYAEAGIEVRNLYGMTETCGSGTVIDGEHAMLKAGSCGLPEFLAEVKVVNEEGNQVKPEERGEVIIKADFVMKGYWNNPEATAESIKNGWLYTGDIAKCDKDGFLYIMDRKKDMIISGGENIYPAEIEDLLLRHPKIQDVGVIGYPDKIWGEAVKAVVVVAPGETMTVEEVIEWTKGKIGKFKMPKSVVFTDALPRTPTGKILKKDLRAKYN
ncbi:MAG: AMP-dependent CoA ligase/synthetase [Acidobacteria bacterium]|nr:AMP-dependent CoA ligase/synthetase [Acidobacteriota bacterium]